MPPKASWKALGRVASNPFRRSSSISRENSGSSKAPSIASVDREPRSESPIPDAPQDAPMGPPVPAPIMTSSMLPISNDDQGAVDLSSPTEARSSNPIIYNPEVTRAQDDATAQESEDVGSGIALQQPTPSKTDSEAVDTAPPPVEPPQLKSALKNDADTSAAADQEAGDVGSGEQPVQAEKTVGFVEKPEVRIVQEQDVSVVQKEGSSTSVVGAGPASEHAAVMKEAVADAPAVAPVSRTDDEHEDVNPWSIGNIPAQNSERAQKPRLGAQGEAAQDQDSEDVGGAPEVVKKSTAPPEYTSPYTPPLTDEKPDSPKDVVNPSQSVREEDLQSEAVDTQAGTASGEVPVAIFIAPGTVVSPNVTRVENNQQENSVVNPPQTTNSIRPIITSAEQSTDNVGNRDIYRGTEESLRAVAASSYLAGRSTDPTSQTTDNPPAKSALETYAPLAGAALLGAGAVYAASKAAQGADPFADSQTGIPPSQPQSVPPSQAQTPLAHTHFSRPYAIPPVLPLSRVDQEEVEADDDNSDGVLAVRTDRADNGPMSGFDFPFSHTPLMTSMEISEWTVFALPNGAKYFCHPKARVVTDVDITHPAMLKKVNKHLEEATRSSQMHHQNHVRRHRQGGSAVGEETRLVDDSTPLPTGTTTGADWPGGFGKRGGPRYGYGATSSGFAYWKADANTHEQGRMMGLEIWLKSLKPNHENGYAVGGRITSPDRESFAPMMMWVDHLSKTVSVDAPWSKLGPENVRVGEEDDAIEPHLRYWEYLQAHPAHVSLPPGAAEEAIEALTWCYTELLLRNGEHEQHHHKYAKTPFTVKESHDLLDLIKNLDSGVAGPLQTNVIAKVHVRLTKHRQHILFHQGEPSDEEFYYVPQREPFRNFLVKGFIGLFCFGIPYLYVPRGIGSHRQRVTMDGYHEVDESEVMGKHGHKQTGLLADSPIFAASVALVASVFITSAIAFLALPGVKDAARLSSFICLFLSASSLAAGIINLRRRALDTQHASKHMEPNHPFIQSLPLVFLMWAVIALVTSAFLYVYRPWGRL
ncbi:hypothetical protein FRB98_005452 [Tulasnella sp. 332]|nr:hypothetical protein FRB98_005452 [Tulasnella sp. 332]